MSTPRLTPLDMNKLEILNYRSHNLASAPSSPAVGQRYFDTATGREFYWTGSAWANKATDSDLLGGATLAQVRDFAQTTGVRDHTAISDFDAQVRASRLDQMAAPTADFSANNHKITNLASPSVSTDAASKAYVDSLVQGMDWKASARVVTATNTTVASPGASIDGVSLSAGDRVLLIGQSTGSQNGLWVWNGAATPMTRPTDFVAGTASAGTVVPVTEGTNADKAYILTTNDPIAVDTTSLAWTVLPGSASIYIAGSGLTESPAGTFNVGAGTGISVAADSVAVDTAVVARKYTVVLSTSATSYVVNHGLANQWVTVQVFENSGSFRLVEVDVELTDANNATVKFAAAPSANAYRVVVVG